MNVYIYMYRVSPPLPSAQTRRQKEREAVEGERSYRKGVVGCVYVGGGEAGKLLEAGSSKREREVGGCRNRRVGNKRCTVEREGGG